MEGVKAARYAIAASSPVQNSTGSEQALGQI